MTVNSLDLIRAFERGDHAYIANLVRHDTELTPEMRQRLADLILHMLNGKWKRSAKRPRDWEGARDKMAAIAASVEGLESQGWKKTAAVAQVAEEFGCSTRWVASQMRRHSELSVGSEERKAWVQKRSPETADQLNWLVFVTCFDDEDDSHLYQGA